MCKNRATVNPKYGLLVTATHAWYSLVNVSTGNRLIGSFVIPGGIPTDCRILALSMPL